MINGHHHSASKPEELQGAAGTGSPADSRPLPGRGCCGSSSVGNVAVPLGLRFQQTGEIWMFFFCEIFYFQIWKQLIQIFPKDLVPVNPEQAEPTSLVCRAAHLLFLGPWSSNSKVRISDPPRASAGQIPINYTPSFVSIHFRGRGLTGFSKVKNPQTFKTHHVTSIYFQNAKQFAIM